MSTTLGESEGGFQTRPYRANRYQSGTLLEAKSTPETGRLSRDFGLSEIQELLASSAREFLADREPFNLARRAAAGDSGFDASFWQEIAQLGWTGLLVPERYGGAGLGLPEFGVLLEECGAALTSGPLLETALLGASVIDRYGNEGQKAELLRAIARGDAVVAHGHPRKGAGCGHRTGLRPQPAWKKASGSCAVKRGSSRSLKGPTFSS